jgi:hypothetical protein
MRSDLDLRARVTAIRGQTGKLTDITPIVDGILQQLQESGLVIVDGHDDASQDVKLQPLGNDLVASHAATSERLYDQFIASLTARTSELGALTNGAPERIAKAAESFIKDCVRRRALGVAMAEASRRHEIRSYHMVALLQGLPQFMAQLKNESEVIALTQVVQGVLARPTDVERKYIGLALQAQFGINILGFDPATVTSRIRAMKQTLFLIDSNVLIKFLARSSIGYDSARLLINRLKDFESSIATTKLLAKEVAENARWAFNKFSTNTGRLDIKTLEAATGKAGGNINPFLEGFLTEVSQGYINSDFGQYMGQVFYNTRSQNACALVDVQRALRREGISCLGFSEWTGFQESLSSDSTELQEQITESREERHTYRRPLQVEAEAEALIVVRSARDDLLGLNGDYFSNAFFISNSRVIDEVAQPGSPITMRPEAALQWAATIKPCDIEEMAFLTNSLLSELSERDLSIVDASKLRAAFSPLIEASKERNPEEMRKYHSLVSDLYGEDSNTAFSESSLRDLEFPIVLENYHIQRTEELEKKLAHEQSVRIAAQTKSNITEQERDELNRYRSKEQARRSKARGKKRAQASKIKKKKKR